MEEDGSLWDLTRMADRFESRRAAPCLDMSAAEAEELVLRCFRRAAEREISVGDGVDVWIMERGKDVGAADSSNAIEHSTGLPHAPRFVLRRRSHSLPQH